ncbi:DUF1295-domain-containing protein [Meredithblackwellia eburnea MCA 4105]
MAPLTAPWLSALPRPPPALLASKTLTPAILSFPSNLPKQWTVDALKQWYHTSKEPMHPALLFATGMSVLVWLLGEVTGNVSQVDRLWTFLPLVYSVHFTFWPYIAGEAGGWPHERQLLVLTLQLLWSARLTTNTYRRGFFNPKSEDYRWEVVRAQIPGWQFKLLNLFFIAFAQNFLLLTAELPQYLLLNLTRSKLQPDLGLVDLVLSGIFVSTLVIEMVADNQQQKYQWLKIGAREGKRQVSETERKKIERGFVSEGLWGISRHPNFACEQFTWYILYAFTVLPFLPTNFSLSSLSSIISTFQPADLRELRPTYRDIVSFVVGSEGLLWNYAVWSPLTMSLLFYASTDLTEKISKGKYPLYSVYQKRVAMFWPPITFLKAFWLFITRQMSVVNTQLYEPVGAAGKKKAQ